MYLIQYPFKSPYQTAVKDILEFQYPSANIDQPELDGPVRGSVNLSRYVWRLDLAKVVKDNSRRSRTRQMGRVHSPILEHACTFSNICSWQARASDDEHVAPLADSCQTPYSPER